MLIGKILNIIRNDARIDDESFFDQVFPESMQTAAEFQFTPVNVAKMAADFLVQKAEEKVLDIGAGAGKFCLIGAATTAGHFTGIEQRESLVKVARQLASDFGLTNINFLHGNITNLGFSDYEAFYIFNPFMEHHTPDDSFDEQLEMNRNLSKMYADYVKQQLAEMPVGTRLATYFSHGDEVPDSYKLVGGDESAKLRFWIQG